MKNKTLKTLIAFILFCSVFQTLAFGESGYVSANYVNVRSGPGMNYNVINCLTRGTVVEITDKSNSSWYAINYNGQSGYMASQYISSNGTVTVRADTPSSSKLMTAEEADAYYSAATPSSEPTPDASASPIPSLTPSSSPTVTVSPSPSAEVTTDTTPASSESTVSSSADNVGTITGDYVRFRTGPGTNHTIITMYNKGQSVTIVDSSGEWYKCVVNGQTGFISSKYVNTTNSAEESSTSSSIIEVIKSQLSSANSAVSDSATHTDTSSETSSKVGYISGNNVRFRSGPSLSASIFTELYFGNSLEIIGSSDSWTKVVYDGKTGYVYSQYVSEGVYSSGNSSQETTSSTSVSGQEIVDFAMQYLGYKYNYGGKDPSTGFDCSGLVWYVYNHFGYAINRVAADQALNGSLVSADELKPGDILCFYTGNSIGHTGIYIGNDKFVHAANSNTGVIITQLSGYYTNRGFVARRICA